MSNYYLATDTETGGFNENTADLLTAYFAILDENYQLIEELDLKLKPNDGRLPIAEAGALKVNGINLKAHLEDINTISYKDGAEKVTNLIKKYLKKKGRYSNILLFGYNVGFDKRWLQKYLIPQDIWESMIHYKDVDVMQAVDFLKRAGWLPKELGTLATVVKYFEISVLNAHTAKGDVLMTIDVEKKLIELMKSKKEGGGSVDLIALLEQE